jgi:5-methylcytosine-specific restriction endonuclease McrA
MCKKQGRVTAAQVVDHITPHKMDMVLFWDTDNWQSLCKRCHDSLKQRIEKSGPGFDAEGNPLDAKHHWRRGG